MNDRRSFCKLLAGAAVFPLSVGVNPALAFSASVPRLFEQGEFLQGTMGAGAGAVVYQDKLFVFHEGGYSSVPYYSTYDRAGSLLDLKIVPGTGMSGKPAVAVYEGRLYLAHQSVGNTGWIYVNSFDGERWTGDVPLNMGIGGSPALAVFKNRLYLVGQGYGADGSLWFTSFDGNSWARHTRIPNVGTSGSPALAVFRDRLICVHASSRNTGWLFYTSFDGNRWSRDVDMHAGVGGSPTLAVFGDRLVCARRARGGGQAVWEMSFDGSTWSNDRVTSYRTNMDPFYVPVAGNLVKVFGTPLKFGVMVSEQYPANSTGIDLLDVWGEGRIATDGMITGFDNCLNLNKYSQTISNGADKGCEIPNLCPVADYDAPLFPIQTGVVRRITLMGAPINERTAYEMLRVLDKGSGAVYLYDPSPAHRSIFERVIAGTGLARRTLTSLGMPFDEVSIRPVSVYAFRDL
ncbi:MAG: hypothetical protein JO067_08120 [Cupriavidus sp.]|nr:hypothetical protein [Cupriavidus sp.]